MPQYKLHGLYSGIYTAAIAIDVAVGNHSINALPLVQLSIVAKI